MEEIWKDVVGFEGLYQVSNLGNVKSVYRKIVRRDGKVKHFKEMMRAATDNGHGYMGVMLNYCGKHKMMYVHRLVAMAFIENPLRKEQVNHIDGNTKNNTISNLEWVTPQENDIHAWKTGLQVPTASRKSVAVKNGKVRAKKVMQFSKDGKYIATWDTTHDADKAMNTGRGNVGAAARGKSKTCCGYIWKYV